MLFPQSGTYFYIRIFGMIVENAVAKYLRVGSLKVEVYPTSKIAGIAAARAVARAMAEQEQESIGMIFATGASQLSTLEALTSMDGLPWQRVRGVHLDEYVGLSADHPASFRRYLRERLTSQVSMKEFFEIDGSAPDPEKICETYAATVRSVDPCICLLGIGENGHLAFNDPAIADFADPRAVKVVPLDETCRQQQAAEGWFASVDEVAAEAITLTIPTVLRVPKLVVSVPGIRKAEIIRRTLEDPISTECPATILRTHPDVTVYLDADSARCLDGVLTPR
jgi:glucosamine-6-phosphate deaminase